MTTPPGPPDPPPAGIWTSPLLPQDPPKIGDFWLDSRLLAGASGIAYQAHEDSGAAVMLVLLSQGAAEDAAARERLAGEVNKMHIDTVVARGGDGQSEGRLGFKFRSEDDDPVEPGHAPLAPWVALAYDGSGAAIQEGRRLLAAVDLSWLPQLGRPNGPDYALHWVDRTEPGMSRLWPLPWPGRYDRAGRLSVFVSWLLMLLIAMVAVLLAILLFSQSNSSSPPPPLPPTGSPPPQSGSPPPSGSPSPQSASPSPQSGSPSPSSGSPSPSQSGSGSPSPSGSQSGSPSPSSGSPSPSGGDSGPTPSTSGGSTTPNSKL